MLRTLAAAALAATSLVSIHAAAQPADAPGRPGPMAHDRMDRAPMTRADVEQRATTMFARLDADGDARLTPADREARTGQRRDDRFARLDTDGNGSISRAEFDAAPRPRGEGQGPGLARPDRGPEGRPARMGGMGPMRGGARAIMASADADHDGTVTQAEFSSAMLARFDAADADHNGTISAQERQAHRPMAGHRMRRAPAGDGPATR